jgi:hypothetical protein
MGINIYEDRIVMRKIEEERILGRTRPKGWKILCLVDQLVGNDLEISNYTTADTIWLLNKQQRIGVFNLIYDDIL